MTYLSFLQLQKVTHETLPRMVHAVFVDAEGNVITNEVIFQADSTSESPQERVMKEKFIFANKKYANMTEYYFIMKDAATGELLEKRQFTIDLFYVE